MLFLGKSLSIDVISRISLMLFLEKNLRFEVICREGFFQVISRE